ncbi:MAG: hypothetical protein ACOC5K_03560, partial [Chloroflexota bacterium]
YTLYTHCGVRRAHFDGRDWIADPVLDDGDRNPPPGWGNPHDTGTMTLLSEDSARFVNSRGESAEFRPQVEDEEYPWAPCA